MGKNKNRKKNKKSATNQNIQPNTEDTDLEKALRLSKQEFDSEKYALDLVKFRSQLKKDNKELKEVTGDGNCLFRAIADQLY